jgi:hypothetical protein
MKFEPPDTKTEATGRELAMLDDYKPSQQRIIKRYYNNQGQIQLQRLSELVTELYLAEGKKRERIWTWIIGALEKLNIPQSRIDHVVKQNNPALIAEIVKELHAKK